MSSPLIAKNKSISSFELFADSSTTDSISTSKTDSLLLTKKDSLTPKNDDALPSKIEYSADDSMRFDIQQQKVFLFGNGHVKYETTELSANYIELDLKKNTVFSSGSEDSLGQIVGKPIFNEAGQEFTMETMLYNFDTKKGKITKAITQEGEGYIHGEQVKMVNEDVIFIKNGKYTTCNLENPHFHIQATKLKFIKDDKIVTGPAYLSVENVPTPLALPFGYFPNKEGRSNGVVIPSYGQHAGLGLYLLDGGYYFSLGEYMDMSILGDIYSRGSWGTKIKSNYRVRYKFNGNFNAEYTKIKEGEPGFIDTNGDTLPRITNNFFVKWKHIQDTKARPGVTFTADVKMGTPNNYKNNLNSSYDNFVANNFISNIAYTKRWGNNYSFAINAQHEQNNVDTSITIRFPQATFLVSRSTPFARKNPIGAPKWYENIGIAYTGKANNEINTKQYVLFNNLDSALTLMKNGVSHYIPVNTQIKAMKYITLNPSFNYNERWNFTSVSKSWDYDSTYNSTTGEWVLNEVKSEVSQQNDGFSRAWDYRTGITATTVIFGMYMFKSQKIKAIRHILTPTVGFDFTPDFTKKTFGIYNSYTDTTGTDVFYQVHQGNLFTDPTGLKRTGKITFSLINNLEMKVASQKDTITGTKKIKLLDNITFNTLYDLSKDSLNWAPLRMTGTTSITKDIKITGSSDWSFYAIDSTETVSGSGKYKYFEYNNSYFNSTGNPMRFTKAQAMLTINLSSKKGKTPPKEIKDIEDNDQLNQVRNNLAAYVDFKQPWTLYLDYNISVQKAYFKAVITNVVNARGDFRITPNWKIGYISGYDLTHKKISTTQLSIFRDLHCWELSGDVIPFGTRKSYTITIRAKSSVLQDLKLSRKRQSQYNPNFN